MTSNRLKVASFFSGCGGLDLGFEQAGFNIVWANEFDSTIHETYEKNHPATKLCKSDVLNIDASDIPDVDGFIGGPPCQSWSVGGRQLGLEDARGKLFLTYINLIKIKRPKFFIIENVDGIITDKHYATFLTFLAELGASGYDVYHQLLNASDYKIPQERKRVFIVGIQSTLNCTYKFPNAISEEPITLRRAIGDIRVEPQYYNVEKVLLKPVDRYYNHDCYKGYFDKKFMSRNRVRSWDELSFTIQAQAKNCPFHPQAPKMVYVSANERKLFPGKEYLYRRLSVRECARIQTFPDSFKFYYSNVIDGYKMVGNAVPPRLAYYIALSIKECLQTSKDVVLTHALVGYYKSEKHLSAIRNNNLYYVRVGLRPGAFTLPHYVEKIKYLIIHNKNHIYCFELEDESPILLSSDELKHMGFTPTGDQYQCFKIKSEFNLADILSEDEKSKLIKEFSYSPKVVEIES